MSHAQYARGRLTGPPIALTRFVYGLMTALLVFLVLAGAVFWSRHQATVAELTALQADALATRVAITEQRALRAEAQLTAIAEEAVARATAQAQATATAVAQLQDPRLNLERALAAVFAAYQQPTQERFDQLAELLGPSVLAIYSPEFYHLQATQRQLGGESKYTVEVLAADEAAEGRNRAEIRTRERWVFDEVNAAGAQQRCVVEDSQQTYGLTWLESGLGWKVDSIRVLSAERRDC